MSIGSDSIGVSLDSLSCSDVAIGLGERVMGGKGEVQLELGSSESPATGVTPPGLPTVPPSTELLLE